MDNQSQLASTIHPHRTPRPESNGKRQNSVGSHIALGKIAVRKRKEREKGRKGGETTHHNNNINVFL